MNFLPALAAVVAFGAASFAPAAGAVESTGGGGWQPIAVNSVTQATDNVVIAADCSGSRCTAVGLVGSSLTKGYPTVITHRRSAEEATAKRMRGTVVGTQPADISCPSPKWCVAVGSIHDSTPADKTWAAVGAGRSWEQVRTPSPGNGVASQAYLAGVSCVSTTDCVAVGHYFDARGTTRALLLSWDGNAWSRQLRRELRGSMPTAVDCTSSGACLVAATAGEQAQFWWWSGGTVTQIPGGSTPANRYVSVSCVSDSWCAAAGGVSDVSPTMAIVSVTNRGKWRWTPKPVRTNRPVGPFNSITCSAKAECLAGTSWLTAGTSHPGIWEWSGNSKRTTRMPGSQGRVGQVTDVACATDGCESVGQSYVVGGDFRLLNDVYQRRS